MLEVSDLQCWYGRVQGLFGVSFDVADGEVLGIVGTNGAGKSTTVRGLLGLLRSTGKVEIDGEDVSSWPTHRRIREARMCVVHEGRSSFPGLTVLENLTVGLPGRQDTGLSKVYEAFPVLSERGSQRVGLLSGGQRQMVSLGRAMLADPRLLVLDEPALGLAPAVGDDVYRVLRELAQGQRSVVLVEQSIARVKSVADRVMLIDGGVVKGMVSSSDEGGLARMQRMAFGQEVGEEEG